MPHFKLGLRPRFLLALLSLTAVLLTGFVYTVSEFVELLEHDLIDDRLRKKMDWVAATFPEHPDIASKLEPGYELLVTARGDTGRLPESLAGLEPGETHEMPLPGRAFEYGVTRRDLDDVSLYLVMDLTPIERLEKEFRAVAWLTGLSALFLSVIIAFWLSWLVTRPVQKLAGRISRVEPGQERPMLHDITGDRELDIIGNAFDKTLDRFDAFVAREQAFTEDASHELRTPLSIVMSTLELLARDSGLSDQSRVRLARARSAAGQMQELIEALLFLARRDTGDCPPIAVGTVLKDAIAAQTHMFAEQGGLDVEIQLDIRAEHYVRVPAGVLLSIFNNLLRNALEHSGPGKIEVVLDGPRVSFRDHGEGIAPALLSRLFDRRFRGPDSRGHGLGLYIVKRVCDRFGWSIDVHSEPGVGTRFDLYLNGETKT